jgi:hypothetical protein
MSGSGLPGPDEPGARRGGKANILGFFEIGRSPRGPDEGGGTGARRRNERARGGVVVAMVMVAMVRG